MIATHDEPSLPLEVLSFIYSIYDLKNSPGTDQQRFAQFAADPFTEDLRRILTSFEEKNPINSVLYRARPGGIANSMGIVKCATP